MGNVGRYIGWLFSPAGTMGNITFLFVWIGFFVNGLVVGLFLGMMVAYLDASPMENTAPGSQAPVILIIFLLTIWSLLFFWVYVCSVIKRLRDLGQSGCLVVCVFIPVVNLVLPLALCFLPGDYGDNFGGVDITRVPQMKEKKKPEVDFKRLVAQAKAQPNNFDILEDLFDEAFRLNRRLEIEFAGKKLFANYVEDKATIPAFDLYEMMQEKNIVPDHGDQAELLRQMHAMGEFRVTQVAEGMLRHTIPARYLETCINAVRLLNHEMAKNYLETQLAKPDLLPEIKDQLRRLLYSTNTPTPGDGGVSVGSDVPPPAPSPEPPSNPYAPKQPISLDKKPTPPPAPQPSQPQTNPSGAVQPVQVGLTALSEQSVSIQTASGDQRALPYNKIRSVGVTVIRAAGQAPALMLSLVLAPNARGVRLVAHIAHNRMNPKTLRPNAATGKQAFAEVLSILLQKSGAVGYPNEDIVKGNYGSSQSLQAWTEELTRGF